MKQSIRRTAFATLGITLGLAAVAQGALAQSAPEQQADFSPAPPVSVQQGAYGYGAAPSAPAMEAPPQESSAVIETTPQAFELAPPSAAEEADAYAHTRRGGAPAPPRGGRARPPPPTPPTQGAGAARSRQPQSADRP